MKISALFFLALCTLALGSCKKDEEAAAPQLAQKIAGSYRLTSVLRNNTLVDVTSTATGDAQITAKNNSTANISYTLKFGNITQTIASDYDVSQNGTDYKLITSSNEEAVVQGNKLKMKITFLSPTSSQIYIVEYTK
jgi:hypothetical protein